MRGYHAYRDAWTTAIAEELPMSCKVVTEISSVSPPARKAARHFAFHVRTLLSEIPNPRTFENRWAAAVMP